MIESMRDTLCHIRRVQSLLHDVVRNLLERARIHDESKLSEPEATGFATVGVRLKDVTYGSEEYKAALRDLAPTIKHHYEHNRHHPEFWSGGIADMTLLDIVEMLVDWKAAGERHSDSSIEKSIEINCKRFGIEPQLESILRRTALELWPEHLQPWHCVGCGNCGAIRNFCEMCGAGKNDYMKQGEVACTR